MVRQNIPLIRIVSQSDNSYRMYNQNVVHQKISITMNIKPIIILIITFLFASSLLADTDEIATAHIKKITGNVAESFMDRYYISNGWEKLRRDVQLFSACENNIIFQLITISQKKYFSG